MKNLILLFLLITTCIATLDAQKLFVPDSILHELHTEIIVTGESLKDSLIFKVVYPHQYDSTKTYPVLLGLSGGNQTETIVNYCYAAWFRSDYFKNHLTVLPVNNNGKNLLHYSQDDINRMLFTIKSNFQVTTKDWIIVGTSNGGRASFNVIAEEPALFQGGIVIPGSIEDSLEVNNSWKHLKFTLAYGDKDSDDWIKATKKTKKALSKYIKNPQIVVLKGQGHILPIDFDIDTVYNKYFK